MIRTIESMKVILSLLMCKFIFALDNNFFWVYRPGHALATGTYNGDLIFWRLETGQSYKRYNVTYPMGLLKLEYMKEKSEKKVDLGSGSGRTSKNSSRGKKDRTRNQITPQRSKVRRTYGILEPPVRTLLAEKANPPVERNLAIHCLIFLRKREILPDQGTLMTATENGMIQVSSVFFIFPLSIQKKKKHFIPKFYF